MESGYEDDQGHLKVTREQNTDRKDCEKNHSGQEKVKIVIISTCFILNNLMA